MRIKPIKTEADYQAALAEVERLFDAAPDTPDGDALDVVGMNPWDETHT
jgi:HTH-type transcriptional regulator/antitoxin HigA